MEVGRLLGYNAAIHDVLVMLSQPMPTYVISADPLRLKRTIRFEESNSVMEQSNQIDSKDWI